MSGFLLSSGKVKVSETDGHLGTLFEKLHAGSNVSLRLILPNTDYEELEISSSGTDFNNVAAALGSAAGANSGYVFKSDGAGSGIMGTNIQNIARRLTVSSTGPDADYNSIRLAILAAIAGGASSANPWEIRVYPGTYTELPMTVQSGIVITADLGERSDTVTVVASDPNLDLFTVTGGSIAGIRASGVTDVVRCLFHVSGPATSVSMRGISVANCSTGICVDGGATLVIANFGCSITSASTGAVTTALKVSGVGSNAIVFSGSAVVPSFIPALYATNPIQTVLYATNEARLRVQGMGFSVAYKDNTATGIRCGGGAYTEILNNSFENCNNALHIDSYDYGVGTEVVVLSSTFSNNVLNFKNESAIGLIFGSWSTDKRGLSNVAGGSRHGYVYFRDAKTARLFGSTKYNFAETNKDVDFEDFFSDNISTGVCDGGIVTVGTGLSVNISAGDGWIHRAALEDSFWVEWDAYNSLALTPSATNYVYYDSAAATFRADAAPPGDTGILVATIVTGTSTIRYNHKTMTPNENHVTRLHDYLMATRKLALSSGLLCSVGTDPLRNISIASGEYYIGLDLISYAGSAAAATFNYYCGLNGAVESVSQTQLNLDSYDYNGTLKTMRDGYYRNDTALITSDGYVSVILGNVEYGSLALAQAGGVGNTPTFLEPSACPVGKIIFKKSIGITEIGDIRPRPAATGSTAVSGISVHSGLSGLEADDHKQYLPVAGGRAMTGNLQMGAHNITGVGTIDGVDVSAHGSRHNPGAIDAITVGTPVAVLIGEAPAEGSNASLARSNHQHGITTGTPSTVGATNAEGGSSSVPRLDHVHAHGDQTDGYFHQLATTGLPGFMNGVDKRKLDGVSSNAAALTGSAPADVTKAVAVVGSGTTAAKADHKHDVSTGTPGTATFGIAAEGSATSLARSDHAHAITSPDAPADVTKAAAAAGSSANIARQDHKHDISTAAPSTIGTANAEGNATSLARSNHIHLHGNQTDGYYHQVATTGLPGFMSGTDKRKLDNISVFGQDYLYAADETTTTTTSSAYRTKVSLTTGSLTGTYRVGCSAALFVGTNNRNVQARLYNVTDVAEISTIYHVLETANTERTQLNSFQNVTFTGAAKTFRIEFNSPNNTATVSCLRARIEIWRVS